MSNPFSDPPPLMNRMNSWLTITRLGGSSSSRKSRRFRTEEAARQHLAKKMNRTSTRQGSHDLIPISAWLYGPAADLDAERPLIFGPERLEAPSES